MSGAWFVYDYDWNPYPIALFDNELEACRLVAHQGYGKVMFWQFGLKFADAERAYKAAP